MLIAVTVLAVPRAQGPTDPFAFLAPDIRLSHNERQRIDRGETIVRVLPGQGHDVATVAITPTSMSPARLIAWTEAIEQLKAGPDVRAVRRVSSPPRPDEFSTLTLPMSDLEDLRKCGPGACEIKLTAAEIGMIRNEIRLAGADWAARANEAFRQVARTRIADYLAGGYAALAPYADGRSLPSRAQAFDELLRKSAFLDKLPPLMAAIEAPAAAVAPEAFVYWATEQFGAKDVVSATHTIITTSEDPSLPAVMIASKQIFATHYAIASLNVTALVRRPGADDAPDYLVVVNRTSVDAIEGLLGGFVRRSIENRVRRETPAMVVRLRDRIEAGPPR